MVSERADETIANAAGETPSPIQSAEDIRAEIELRGGNMTETADQVKEDPAGQHSLGNREKETARSVATRAEQVVPDPLKRAGTQGRQVLQQAVQPLGSTAEQVRHSTFLPVVISFALGVLCVLALQAARRRRRRKRSISLGQDPREWLSQSSQALRRIA